MIVNTLTYSPGSSTGKRRYGHPALTGVLPQPWLPIKKGQSLANSVDQDGSSRGGRDQAVVLTLRKRYSATRRDIRDLANKSQAAIGGLIWNGGGSVDPSTSAPLALRLSSTPPSVDAMPPLRASNSSDNVSNVSNPWRDRNWDPEDRSTNSGRGGRPLAQHGQTLSAVRRPMAHRLSFDQATGVIILPDDGEWLLQDEDSDSEGGASHETVQHDEAAVNGGEPTGATGSVDSALGPGTGGERSSGRRHRTYYHHPERRRQTLPGAFPRSSPQS